MLNDEFTVFIDRRKAIDLFNQLRSRNPDEPWPLRPILTFLGPGGSGKSRLIEHLRSTECCLPPDGRAAMPYAYLDFTLPNTKKDLLSILLELRNQLQRHKDISGKHLTFKRFNLGAEIALANQTSRSAYQPGISSRLFAKLSEMISLLSFLSPLISPISTGMKLGGQALSKLISYLKNRSVWQWYKISLHLPINASNSLVRTRLLALSTSNAPDRQGREHLIAHLLPAAFLADLNEALAFNSSDAPRAWSKVDNIILFLDGFEVLLDDDENTGVRLLEGLAITIDRQQNRNDPLLLVIGSQKRLFDCVGIDPNPPSEGDVSPEQHVLDRDLGLAENYAREHARDLYEQWHQRPHPGTSLELCHLYLPLWLDNFELAYVRRYLNRQIQLTSHEEEDLVHAVYRITHGYPILLDLAKSIFLEALKNDRQLTPREFEQKFEQAKVSPEVAYTYKYSFATNYLIDKFLHGLPPDRRRNFIFCAIPRTLDVPILRTVLQVSDNEANERWNYYRSHTLMRTLDNKRLVLNPTLRKLILQNLSVSDDPDSDYYKKHALLRDYFHRSAQRGEKQAKIEEAYHALALGDPEPAIDLAYSEHQNIAIWELLLEAVEQAPTGLIPPSTEQRAREALEEVKLSNNPLASVTAIILNIWLHSAAIVDTRKATDIQRNQLEN